MKYYAFTEEQHSKIIKSLNTISVTGINQNDAFHEATDILRKPALIETEEVDNDGKEIHKTELAK
jgi:hypothetical protein